jgi:hypothetical protein
MMTDLSNYTGRDGRKSWLCVDNVVSSSTVTASTTATGYDATAVKGPQTYSTWSPASMPAWVKAEPQSSGALINYVACYLLDGEGCAVTPQHWDGMAWVDLGAPMVAASGEPDLLLWIFDAETVGDIRLTFSGSFAPFVSVFKAGYALVMPYCLAPGYSPSALNPDDTYSNVFSEGGQILGAQLDAKRAVESLAFNNLAPNWVRLNWPTTRDKLRTEGVVFAWRPDSYPTEIMYGMVTGTPSVSYETHTRMALTLTLEGPA